MSDTYSSGGGIGLGTALGLVFVTLKLTDVIDWPWVWVLAPFWIPIAFAILVFSVIALVALVKK